MFAYAQAPRKETEDCTRYTWINACVILYTINDATLCNVTVHLMYKIYVSNICINCVTLLLSMNSESNNFFKCVLCWCVWNRTVNITFRPIGADYDWKGRLVNIELYYTVWSKELKFYCTIKIKFLVWLQITMNQT